MSSEIKESYHEWEFPQPKWLWDFDRVLLYLDKIEEELKLERCQEKSLEDRNNELKILLFDHPDDLVAKQEIKENIRSQEMLNSMSTRNYAIRDTLEAVLGKGDHHEAFMKWRYLWDENGVCLGLRDLTKEKEDATNSKSK